MHPLVTDLLAAGTIPAWLNNVILFAKVLIGFSIIIFVHELGHFLAAKWVGVRVDRFAVGFGPRLFGWRPGEGLTFGERPDYRPDEAASRGYGETDYCFKALPFGGYVKMLGQDDIVINEETGDVKMTDDPRAFTNRPVGQRMVIVSAGVIFNLLFAALALMTVFLMGKEVLAPVVGLVGADSAAQGKILPGDRIVAVDGDEVRSFEEIRAAIVFADGPIDFTLQREGEQLPLQVTVPATRETREEMLGLTPRITTERLSPGIQADDLPNLDAGDTITHVDGKPVDDLIDVLMALRSSEGRILPMTVQRPQEGNPKKTETVTAYQRGLLSIEHANLPGQREDRSFDDMHLLGFLRRRAVAVIEPGSPAEQAGFKTGDVILQWGPVANPTYSELIRVIQSKPVRAATVAVDRGGERVELTVTPSQPFSVFSETTPRVGLNFVSRSDRTPIVADVVPGTPAAELNVPRGARILSVAGRDVLSWSDVAETFMDSAGETVDVVYRTGGEEVTGQLDVPSSLVNELDLPPTAIVWSVNGERAVKVDGKEYSVAGNAAALRAALEQHVGDTVTISYSPTLKADPVKAEFAVREDNVDPWQLRIAYELDHPLNWELQRALKQTSNPLVAMVWGVQEVGRAAQHVYSFLTSLATQNIGTEHVAGPVGIINLAMQQARLGLNELLFFLAFLSVNLAVINFLPMPVMDGGLMLFLIIEKIKGRPLSFRTQMISTLVGLAAILLIAVFVTIQDISRIFG